MIKNKVDTIQRFLALAFHSSRPVSWINTAFPFAAAYIATGGQLNLLFFALFIYFLIPYNLLIYVINDIYDYESDIKNPRKNSIEGAILPASSHKSLLWFVISLNALYLIGLFATGSLWQNIMLVLIATGAISYSMPPLRLKERPYFDSINSGLHFVAPMIFGLYLTGWENSYWIYVAAFLLWGAASHAIGAVQDIVPDRRAEIISIATHLGAAKTVRLSLVFYIACAAALLTIGWPYLLVSMLSLIYAINIVSYINLTDALSASINKAWKNFLLLNQLSGFVITLFIIYSTQYA